MLALFLGAHLLAADSIQSPEAFLGYPLGSRITTFREQESYFKLLASSGKVMKTPYGLSTEGRPLNLYLISNPSNLQRLEAIKGYARKLHEGTISSDELSKLPAIVWINECIHGNEPASFESAMETAYTLSKGCPDLNDALVILNPVYNPDGHERYAVWYNSVAVGSSNLDSLEQSEPDWVTGRLNHYRFDMNRDRISLSQKETRQEIKAFQQWNPHVYVDQHGQVQGYFFPPNALSQNGNVTRDSFTQLTEIFGKANAKAFDAKGWTYYVRDIFDLYYPGYLDAWTCLNGAVGMTYETGGSKQIARMTGPSEYTLTLKQGIERHSVSALATIHAAAVNRASLLTTLATRSRDVVAGKPQGDFKRVIIESDNRRAVSRLAEKLALHRIDFSFAKESFSQKGHDYWSTKTGLHEFSAGSLIIDMAQPNGRLAKALLEPTADFEPEFIKAQFEKREKAKVPQDEGYEFYDVTGWSLPYAYGLKAYWSEETPKIEAGQPLDQRVSLLDSTIGWYWPYRDDADILLAARLSEAGFRVEVAPKEMKLEQGTVPAQAFMILKQYNAENSFEKLKSNQESGLLKPFVGGFPSSARFGPGSENTGFMAKPNVGIVFSGSADFSATWFLFDQVWKLGYTPLKASAVENPSPKLSTIVMPGSLKVSAGLRKWIGDGGCLVVTNDEAAAFKEFGALETYKIDTKLPIPVPGPLGKATIFNPENPLTFGYDPKQPIAVPVNGNSFYKYNKEIGDALVKIGPAGENALSGWFWKEETSKAMADTVWMQSYSLGAGRVVVFRDDPLNRLLYPGLFKLFLNAVYLGPASK